MKSRGITFIVYSRSFRQSCSAALRPEPMQLQTLPGERRPGRADSDLCRMPQLPCAEWEWRNPSTRSGDSFKDGGHTRSFCHVAVESHALDA